VDDDASFLMSMKRLLGAAGFSVKAYPSATEFLAQRPPDAPGCVVTDLQMPGMNGTELQEALAASKNPLPIVFLTGTGDIPTSVHAMRHGAEDFLTKTANKEGLLGAVNRALARDVVERQARARREQLEARFAALSPRELAVLQRVLLGRLNKQIADDLRIDERSVKRHRTSFMAKLKVQSVAELVQLADERSRDQKNLPLAPAD
jgi:FixJ family two-component response regulator